MGTFENYAIHIIEPIPIRELKMLILKVKISFNVSFIWTLF